MNFNHDICCIPWKYKVKSLSIRQQIEDEFLFNSVWISPLSWECWLGQEWCVEVVTCWVSAPVINASYRCRQMTGIQYSLNTSWTLSNNDLEEVYHSLWYNSKLWYLILYSIEILKLETLVNQCYLWLYIISQFWFLKGILVWFDSSQWIDGSRC